MRKHYQGNFKMRGMSVHGLVWRGMALLGGARQRKVFTVRNIPYQEYFDSVVWHGGGVRGSAWL